MSSRIAFGLLLSLLLCLASCRRVTAPVSSENETDLIDVELQVAVPEGLAPNHLYYSVSNYGFLEHYSDPQRTDLGGYLDPAGHADLAAIPDTGYVLQLDWNDEDGLYHEWLADPFPPGVTRWSVDARRSNSMLRSELRVEGQVVATSLRRVTIQQRIGGWSYHTRSESFGDSIPLRVPKRNALVQWSWDLGSEVSPSGYSVVAVAADTLVYPFARKLHFDLDRIQLRLNRAWQTDGPLTRNLYLRWDRADSWMNVEVTSRWSGEDIFPLLVIRSPFRLNLDPPSWLSETVPSIDAWMNPADQDTLDIDFGSLVVRIQLEGADGRPHAFHEVHLTPVDSRYGELEATTDDLGQHTFLLPPGIFLATESVGNIRTRFEVTSDTLLVLREDE